MSMHTLLVAITALFLVRIIGVELFKILRKKTETMMQVTRYTLQGLFYKYEIAVNITLNTEKIKQSIILSLDEKYMTLINKNNLYGILTSKVIP